MVSDEIDAQVKFNLHPIATNDYFKINIRTSHTSHNKYPQDDSKWILIFKYFQILRERTSIEFTKKIQTGINTLWLNT